MQVVAADRSSQCILELARYVQGTGSAVSLVGTFVVMSAFTTDERSQLDDSLSTGRAGSCHVRPHCWWHRSRR